jgi:membrane-bound lytic murein transglycosylase A
LLLHAALRHIAVAVLAVWLGAGIAPREAAGSPPKQQQASSMKSNVIYTPLSFAQIPGWEEDDHAAAFKAFRTSCERILTTGRERSSSDKAAAAPSALVAACTTASRMTGAVPKTAAKSFFEQAFTPNSVSHKGPRGVVTGYYEPLMKGSRTPQGEYQTPIHKRPPDLVTLVDETRRASRTTITHGRKTEAGVEPYASRAAIEQGALKGRQLELVYFADPVDVFFLHIQGSGRVKLTDGSVIRVHYDGKNGHPYSSIGRYLIEKGLLAADKVSMDALKNWLRADPERGRQVMWQNASYIFFRELKGEEAKGTVGAMQTPLTPGRSLAVDPRYNTLGMPIFVNAEGMTHVNRNGTFRRLMVAQDVGSAIKGPERGDIYFGSGDAAGRLAGVTKHTAKFIVLLPKDSATQAAAASGSPGKGQQ